MGVGDWVLVHAHPLFYPRLRGLHQAPSRKMRDARCGAPCHGSTLGRCLVMPIIQINMNGLSGPRNGTLLDWTAFGGEYNDRMLHVWSLWVSIRGVLLTRSQLQSHVPLKILYCQCFLSPGIVVCPGWIGGRRQLRSMFLTCFVYLGIKNKYFCHPMFCVESSPTFFLVLFFNVTVSPSTWDMYCHSASVHLTTSITW